jgi:hypothetical protein
MNPFLENFSLVTRRRCAMARQAPVPRKKYFDQPYDWLWIKTTLLSG